MFSESAVEWNEESFCKDWEDAKRIGEGGEGNSVSGGRSKLNATDQVEDEYIRVGTIKCSTFGGLRKHD
jgi:hypothetical protein